MSTRNFKLGLLTLVVLGAALAALFATGLSLTRPSRTDFHTYFDESVQGLVVGAPVDFRGVPIGAVTAIDVAPDRRLVHVALGLDSKVVDKLGLAHVPPDLRAQLSMQGITGVELVDLDFVNPVEHPPPPLDFQPLERYIPFSRSLIKNLSDNLASVLQQLTPLVDSTTRSIHRIDEMLASFDKANVPQQLGELLGSADAAVDELRDLIKHTDHAKLPDKAASALNELDRNLGQILQILMRVGGSEGLVANANRAVRSLGDAAGSDLSRTLRNLDEAAEAVRDLAQTIERQPDVLLKGRAKERTP